MRKLLKGTGYLLLFVLLLLLLVLAALWALAGTDRGFAFAAAQVEQRVEGLELGQIGGNLLGGIDTDELNFESDALALRARGLDSAWRIGCLLQREFCVDRIILDEVRVETFDTGEPPPPVEPGGDITLPSIALPIDVTVTEVLVKKFIFQAPGDAPEQVVEDIRLGAATRGSDLTIDELAAKYQNFAVDGDGTLTLDGDFPIDIALRLDATDIIEKKDVDVVLNLNDTVADLTFDATVSGALQAKLAGKAQPLKKTLPVDVALTSRALGWPLDTKKVAKAENVNVIVKGDMDDYSLYFGTRISGAQVPDTTLAISGRVNPERLDLPTVRVDTLGGRIDGNAGVNFQDTLNWRGNLKIADIQPAKKYPDVTGRLGGVVAATGTVDDGRWTLALDQTRLEGVLRDYPFALDAKLGKNLRDVWSIQRFTLDNGKNQITAKGKVGTIWDLSADIDLPQLQNLLPQLAGGFDASLNLSGKLAEPDIDLDASSDSVKFNDILVQGVDIQSDVKRAGLAKTTLTVKVARVRVADNLIQNTALELAGTRADHGLKFFVDGPQATSVDLAVNGSLADDFSWKGLLDEVELEVPAHVIELGKPTAIAWDNQRQLFSIDAHCWTSADSNLCLENPVEAKPSGQAVISLDRYDLSRLDVFMPAETTLAGNFKLDTTLDWGKAQPGGLLAEVALGVDDGAATVSDEDGNPIRFDYQALDVDATLDAASVDAGLVFASQQIGDARVDLKLDPEGEKKAIDGNLNISDIDIGVAKAFVPEFDRLEGLINADGKLSGFLDDPRFDGKVLITDLAAAAEMLPLSVLDGSITTNILGKRAFLDGDIDTNDEGTIKLEGSANWQQADAWRGDVQINGKRLNIRSDPLTESDVNPALQISLRPQSVRVGGKVRIPYARIDVAELPEGAKSLSDDVVVVEDIEKEDAPENTVDSAFRTVVDVQVILGDDVDLSAYGLEASLTGDMSVGVRSPNPPQLGGEIQVVDGIFKKYGQNLKADGQILFVGPVGQSRLDIQAVREIDDEDRVAGFQIEGSVDNPELSLFTEPADKSDEAILSYIVLGRDLGAASDQDASLLAAAALALTVRGGKTVGSKVADQLGIQEFGFEAAGSGDDTELVASGRINDDLLVRFGQNVFDQQQTVYLRYDLTKKLYIEAASGAADAVDLFYSFAF